MGKRNPSRAAKSHLMHKESDDEVFTIDYPISLIAIMMAIVMGGLTVILLQVDMGRLYDIAIQQSNMLSLGAVFVFLAAIWTTRKGNLRIRIAAMWEKTGQSDRMDVLEGTILMFLVFGITRAIGAVYYITFDKLFNIGLSSTVIPFWAGVQIVFTSAVYEEIFFSLGLGLLMYLVIKEVLIYLKVKEQDAAIIAIIMTSIGTGILFAIYHIIVYGVDPLLLGYLFVVRVIYCVSFLYTRKLYVPMGAHMVNNVTIPFM